VDESLAGKKFFHFLINIFFANISEKNFYLGLKLSLNHFIKTNKNIIDPKFMFNKIYPTHTGAIINK
jgi:hypothetical protein